MAAMVQVLPVPALASTRLRPPSPSAMVVQSSAVAGLRLGATVVGRVGKLIAVVVRSQIDQAQQAVGEGEHGVQRGALLQRQLAREQGRVSRCVIAFTGMLPRAFP